MKQHCFLLSICFFFFISCKNESVDHEQDWEKWNAQRLENLTKKDGWTTVVGLFWLEQGSHFVGADSSLAVVFPAEMSDTLVKINITAEDISLEILHPDVKVDGQYTDEIVSLNTDMDEETSYMTWEAYTWFLIKRGDKIGIRLRNKNAPRRQNLRSIPTFDFDTQWQLEAKFEKAKEGQTMEITNVVGQTNAEDIAGYLHFEKNNKTYRLTVQEAGDQYFVIVGDASNGGESYGGGRFLYVDNEDSEGSVTLDFNRLYNPPCVYTDYATCPLPPRENILSLYINAGEKYVARHK